MIAMEFEEKVGFTV